MESNTSSIVPKIIGGIVAISICCACAVIAAAGFIVYRAYQQTDIDASPFPPTPASATPESFPTLEPTSTESVSVNTFDALNQTIVPENDPYELACRLKGICDVPRTVPGKAYQVGDKEQFWILNGDTAEHRQITATLLYITPHSYFWAENGAYVNQDDMKRLMDTFEEKIYPTNREFFGGESNPGIDDDPHIFVIYADGLGRRTAGYFNSRDPYNPLVKEFSNAHETFMISTTQDLAVEYTYATLAHEFVHMIQDAHDRNDLSWLNEGFAEVGAFINGYNPGTFALEYTYEPDLQLTDWLGANQSNRTHYGQSFLYLTYFLDRFGEHASQALTNNPEDSIASVDDTLAELGITDPLTGQIVTADDVFMDWAAALYLMDESVGDGRYTYHNYPDAPRVTSAIEFLDSCPQLTSGTVNQYGIDYIGITCAGEFTLHFKGATTANLLPTTAHSGDYAFWSNTGNESDMTLTREFDFTNVSAPIEISFWTWYDIELDYDYVYVEVSTDGKTWEILKAPSSTDYDPSGSLFGWGYTGATDDWIQESVDLSKFAGQKVQIRFEYVTDAAVNGEGFLLDDVRVDAAGYGSDFEAGDDGWVANGFVRVDNVLPQTYRLSLILKSDSTTVTNIPLDEDNTVEIPLSLKSGDEAILIVAGTTRFTKTPAVYQVEIK